MNGFRYTYGVPTLECPRCGYDLSGQAAAWTESCPLRGRCSECGLEVEWSDVHHPERQLLQGFVEHERGAWGVFAAAWRTWRWTLLPWRFWKRVRLEHTPVPGRIVLWLVLTLVLIRVLAGIMMTTNMLTNVRVGGWTFTWFESLSVWTYELFIVCRPVNGGPLEVRERLSRLPPFVSAGLAISIFMPIALMALPHTRRAAKVRLLHVVRAGAYGLAWLVPFLFTLVLRDAMELGAPLTSRPVFQATAWMQIQGWTPPADVEESVFWIGMSALWLAAWWWFALRVGFRIHPCGRVWWAMAIPSALAAMIALALNFHVWRWLA